MSGPPMHHGVKHGIWLNPATMEHECWWAGELRWTVTAEAWPYYGRISQKAETKRSTRKPSADWSPICAAPAGSGHPTEDAG